MDSEKGFKSENREEKELDFEAGVREALAKIDEALKEKDMVFVAIYGSGINVGKTTLLGTLSRTLKERGISTSSVSTQEAVHRHPPFFPAISESPKRVLFFESEGLPFKNMDIRLFITSPEARPFDVKEKEFADLVIMNREAKEK